MVRAADRARWKREAASPSEARAAFEAGVAEGIALARAGRRVTGWDACRLALTVADPELALERQRLADLDE